MFIPARFTRSISLPLRALVLGSLALAGGTGSASAQSLLLHGIVSTTEIPAIQQSWVNAPIAALAGLRAEDTIGNDGVVGGALSVPSGRLVLTSHACSGGGPGYFGQGSAAANGAVVLDYVILSSTIPAGAPVTVTVNWALSARLAAVGEDLVGANSSASATSTVHFALAPNYDVQVNRSGSVTRSVNSAGQERLGSGTLNAEGDDAPYSFPMLVGQVIRITISCDLATSSSIELGQADGDAQLAAVWGLTTSDSSAHAVLLSDPSQPAPPGSTATPADAQTARPPRPIDLMPCFTFAQQPRDTTVCTGAAASFTVAPGGLGPFTYQWRKDGEDIFLQNNPTSQSATLSIPNATAADVGTYVVMITDHCGNLSSQTVNLALCTTSAGPGPGLATRLAPARPAPFHAATTLGFDQAAAGVAQLEVFDVRGARVRLLANGWRPAGHTELVWHGDDEAGRSVPAGVYLVRLRIKGFVGTQRVVRLP